MAPAAAGSGHQTLLMVLLQVLFLAPARQLLLTA
jgi:hypothetical protein